MTTPRVFDAVGRPVSLGQELGRGGEGAVFEVPDKAGQAAKIYLKAPDRAKAEKIAAMVAMATPRLTALAAWPVATLHLSSGALAGFAMPKLGGHRPVFQVYGLRLRLRAFPKADWRFLVHAAGNIARAFGVMHENGLVVGDVNHGNLFVAQDATVQFIDTDSFQVSQPGKRWTCDVGVGTHQPPEMQGITSYRDVVRTPNHDNFGLAVLIFQLLCIGKHPFSGRYLGSGEPPDIERAITESRYAYGTDTQRTQMAPAPGSLPMSALPPGILALFDQAFAPGATKGGRPSPEQWVAELTALGKSLRKCGINAAHWFAPQAASCPWCEIEARSGTVLFPAVFITGHANAGGIALLWQAIEAVQEPAPLPRLMRPAPTDRTPSASIVAAGQRRRHRQVVIAAAVTVGVVLSLAVMPSRWQIVLLPLMAALAGGFWFIPQQPERQEVQVRLADAKALWMHLETDWVPDPAVAAFHTTRERLASLKRQHDALAAEREREIKALAGNRQQNQLAAYLESFELSSCRIPGIGKAKVATLLSYGIETVADFDERRLEAVPGFGPKTVNAMIAYRIACENNFRFDPARSVAQAEVAKLDSRISQQRATIEAELTAGLARLKSVCAAEARRRHILEARAAELRPMMAQALADAAVMAIAI